MFLWNPSLCNTEKEVATNLSCLSLRGNASKKNLLVFSGFLGCGLSGCCILSVKDIGLQRQWAVQ